MENLSLNQLTTIIKSPDYQSIPTKNIILRKISAGLILFSVDIIVLTCIMILSLIIRDFFWPGEIQMTKYFGIIGFTLLLFPFAFFLRGLYPGFGIDAIEELRTLTYSITIVFSVLAILSFLVKEVGDYSRFAFIMTWALSLIFIPIARSLVRKYFSEKSWWGIPVIIIGAGKAGEKVINSLQKHRQIGLRPMLAVDDDVDRWGYIDDIPVIGGLDVVPELANKLNIDHAIIAMPNVARKRQQEIVQTYSKYFSFATIIPDLYGITSLWVSSRDLGGLLGLEVQQRLLKRASIIKKRMFDIFIAASLSLIAMPLILLVSLWIKIDSKGKIFFRQQRMGINNSLFEILKFRTMHVDAERRLKDLLKQDSELRAEYEVYHKMKNDPRLTRVGKILRKFSLDELPQFWNVIKGEMSLIGPRAYMPWEKVKMNGHEEMILKVKPGISGLWQVTDRNQSSFEERNTTDVYYIRNWSMFLDLYILARTISVVFMGKGAY